MTDFETFIRISIISDRSSAMADNNAPAEASCPDEIRYLSISDGLEALAGSVPRDLIIVDLNGWDDTADILLDRVEKVARSERTPAIIIFPPDMIDHVAALISAPSITLLCDPTPLDRVSAIALALEAQRLGRSLTNEQTTEGLRSLADEVARIARALAALAGDDGRAMTEGFSDGLVGYRAEPLPRPDPRATVTAAQVRNLVRARRLRDKFLSPDLFGEPAWDMLLDLFAAQIERSSVAVSSLCIAAAVPPTTALRTIRTMTDRGLLERIDDPADRRRVFIALTPPTADAMRAYVIAAHSPTA